MNRSTKSMTHGAITAALSVILILIDRLLGGFIMSFLPLPLIIYGIYYNFNQSILTYIVSVLLVMIIPGQLPTTILMMTYGFVGLVYIGVMKTNWRRLHKFLVVFGGNLINYLIMMKFFGKFFGMDFQTLTLEIQMIFKSMSTQNLQIIALIVLLLTIAIETFIIYISSTRLIYLMKRHRL